MDSTVSLEHLIRKLRKKLRQIENLDRLNRPLSEEELTKVESKYSVREQLKAYLETFYQEQEQLDHLAQEKSNDTYDENQYGEVNEQCIVQEQEIQNNLKALVEDRELKGQKDVYKLEQKQNTNNCNEVPSSILLTKREDQNSKDVILPRQSGDFKEKKAVDQAPENRKKEDVKTKSLRVSLSQAPCRVTYLEGHSDIITSLIIVNNKVISASRDTTLRSWDIHTGLEEHIFGGHTESVTCVIALDDPGTQIVKKTATSDDTVIVSGSFDSTIKFWSLHDGQMLQSIYTFNPVTCICVCDAQAVLISGSDGGKLELWDLASGSNQWSNIVHQGSITGVKVSGSTLVSSSSDGVIKVQNISDDRKLSCMFESENMKSTSGRALTVRHVRCIEFCPKGIVYGDDSRNIKIVDWKKGIANKISNHCSNFTSTDAIHSHDNFLVSSSYDLDSGLGYINVRNSKTLDYLASIDDGDTERIVCLGVSILQQGNLVIVSGGMELKLWEIGVKDSQWRTSSLIEDPDTITLHYKSNLSRPAIDSESSNDEADDADDESESDDFGPTSEDDYPEKERSEESTWMSWCSVL